MVVCHKGHSSGSARWAGEARGWVGAQGQGPPPPSAWEPAASRGSLELSLLQPLSARRERMPSSCMLGPGETGVRRTHTSGVRSEHRNSSEASKAKCTWAWEEVDASALPLEMVDSLGVDGRAGPGGAESSRPPVTWPSW